MSTGAREAVIRGLRKQRDEAQLTRVLASIFQCEPAAAAHFVRMLVSRLGVDASSLPNQLPCSTEQRVPDGRIDLRFQAAGWDVIVELKIAAGYGDRQLERYLPALSDAEHAYLVAVTRDMPLYGEPPTGGKWRGSIQWRGLLPDLRELPIADHELGAQWRILLDILDEEGSMGFTRPKPELFDAYALIRVASEHIDAFVEALREPLLAALRDVLGGHASAAGFAPLRGRIAHSNIGATFIPFAVPVGRPPAVEAGVFAYNPPTRFFVAPANGRALAADQSPPVRAVAHRLIASDFRDQDLRAFLPLGEQLVESDGLERTIIDWAHRQFTSLRDSGLFELSTAVRPSEVVDTPDA